MGFDTSLVAFPIVHTRWSTWEKLSPFLLNGTALNASITEEGVNLWRAVRSGPWFPIWMSVCLGWCVLNIGLTAKALTFYPREKRLAVVVLWLQIAGNVCTCPLRPALEWSPEFIFVVRIPFLTDPFGVWWMYLPVIQVFHSISWPLHVASCILIVLMWYELVTRSAVNIRTGFLTTSRYPAVVLITIVIAVEIAMSCVKVLGVTTAVVNLGTYVRSDVDRSLLPLLLTKQIQSSDCRALYGIVFVGCIIIYVYVYIKVYMFLKASPMLSERHNILQRVSIRFLLLALSLVAICAVGAFYAGPPFFRALGQSILHFSMNVAFLAGSSFIIAAFWAKPGLSAKASVIKDNSDLRNTSLAPEHGSDAIS